MYVVHSMNTPATEKDAQRRVIWRLFFRRGGGDKSSIYRFAFKCFAHMSSYSFTQSIKLYCGRTTYETAPNDINLPGGQTT